MGKPGDRTSELAKATTGFNTTQWNLVQAARQGEPLVAQEALERLCHIYWYPIYAFVRRQGYPPETAQDLTQAFYLHLLRHDFLRCVAPEKGRFRSFLLACLKHFLVDEWKKGRTLKRGGVDGKLVSFEQNEAEGRYELEHQQGHDPKALYDRRWALAVLQQVLQRLRNETAATERTALFDELKDLLMAEPVPEQLSPSAKSKRFSAEWAGRR